MRAMASAIDLLSWTRARSTLVAATVALVACGNKGGAGAAPAADAGQDATEPPEAGEGGEDSVAYPAFPIDAPQVRKNQGTIIAAPVIVTVTWPGDTYAPTWEGFGDAIGASTYWSATTSEYGVGPATSGPSNHVRMTQPLPSTFSYTDMQGFVVAWVQAALADAGAPEAGADAGDAGAPDPTWPAPTLDASGNDRTIYSLFVPASTDETDPGSHMGFCVEGGFAYHDDVIVDGKPIAYAVTLECSSMTLPDLEESAAHEMVEAATDPDSESSPPVGYIGFDTNHVAWDLYTGYNDELADACQNWQDSYIQQTGTFPYWVQSSWSNTAALAGHDPCVPHAAGPYHGMTVLPSQEATVPIDLASLGDTTTKQTQGFKVTVGQPLTFQIGYFSDAPTAPWTISYDFPTDLYFIETTLGNGTATVAIDKKSGQNGDVANVTVTVKTKAPAGFHVLAITWDPPTGADAAMYLPHYLPLVLVDQ